MKPSGWYYGLAVLALLLGFPIAVAASYPAVRAVPAAIEKAYDLSRLTQVLVPGSAEITLSRTGAYAVYYEYRSVVDGTEYSGSQEPPSLECSLASATTGRELPVVPDVVETNRYDAGPGRRAGLLIMSTTINDPGNYTFSCRYPDGREQPEIVLAFGHNIVWECIGVITRTAGPLLRGLAALVGSGVVASGIVIVVAILRYAANG
jgi:hypothetical protein